MSIFYAIGLSFDKTHFTYNLVDQGTRLHVQVLKSCKSVQESSEEILDFKSRQLVSIKI